MSILLCLWFPPRPLIQLHFVTEAFRERVYVTGTSSVPYAF